ISSIAADLGYTMLFPALANGGTLEVISHDMARDGRSLSRHFAQRGIDYLKVTPSHLRGLLEASSTDAKNTMPSQKLVLGGEAATREWVSSLASFGVTAEIWNHYGPTESTVGVLVHRFTKSDVPLSPIPI